MSGSDERGPWYLLTGLVLGVIIGLFYAWRIQPVSYTGTNPSSLSSDFKDQYRALIAAAYVGNEDLVRARERLELLDDEDMFRALTEQAQRTLAENGSDREAQALGLLAIALGQAPPGPAVVVTQPGGKPTPPATPTPTAQSMQSTGVVIDPSVEAPTGLPALTESPTVQLSPGAASTGENISAQPTATPAQGVVLPTAAIDPDAPFTLLSQDKVCEPVLDAPLFQVEVLDRFNRPAAGVLVIVSWEGGEERFYTGLKPEKGPGYADFAPAAGTFYTIQVGQTGTPVAGLVAVMCSQSAGAPTWGAWLLQFVQP